MFASAASSATDSSPWNYKQELLPELVRSVPALLKNQDKKTGRFGSGLWLPADQNVIYPLAAAWAFKHPANPWCHDSSVLNAIMAGGDCLIGAQEKDGRWIFRKKDNSTWGEHFDPWVYSRWIRAFSLISDAMPAPRRTRWQKALELGYSGIAKHELSRVHNIPSHHAMGLFVAGQALHHPEWCEKASAFLLRVAEAQDPAGFWSEHVGPVIHYDFVYTDALGTYFALSHDQRVLPALQRAARFHAQFTYPDGSSVETVDERNPYQRTVHLPDVGFSVSPEGRRWIYEQHMRFRKQHLSEPVDALASLLLYGEEGPLAPEAPAAEHTVFISDDGKASVIRQGPWCASLSAYTAPLSSSRWIQDRQNFLSLFHAGTGLILGGGNTKLQPLWSSFTVGDSSRLSHRPGDENPNFAEPASLLHVPSTATLETNGQSLALAYGPVACQISLALPDPEHARITVTANGSTAPTQTEAHLTFLPALGKPWRAASGLSGDLGNASLKLTGEKLGSWFEHNGWRVELPQGSRLTWPVLPHNPYRKDGHAELAEGRIVVTVPFNQNVRTQMVNVSITSP